MLGNINPDNDKTSFDKRFNNFENKLERLVSQVILYNLINRETKVLQKEFI